MGWAVKFEGVSKRYRGGGPRYGSLRHDVSAGLKNLGRLFGRNGAETMGKLALEDVSFEVQQGESFAIIGPNGAGKTTALRIISRITYPTAGRVRVRGRVGALIEVGSGVHPELTARENIWLYGQILGMGKADVRRRFDRIVEFAELSNELDIPVKMYSSGMQLRLGFAIASHLDPDVFVVDEALAVGDATFQAKCAERMSDLVAEGRALLFVSHNLSVVEAICTRGLFLAGGRSVIGGSSRQVLQKYIEWIDEGHRQRKSGTAAIEGRGLRVEEVTVRDSSRSERYVFAPGESMEVRIALVADREIPSTWFSLGVSDGRPGALVMCSMLERERGVDVGPGKHVVACRFAPLPLGPRTYELWLNVREKNASADLITWSRVGSVRIRTEQSAVGPSGITASWMYAPVRVEHEWIVDEE